MNGRGIGRVLRITILPMPGKWLKLAQMTNLLTPTNWSNLGFGRVNTDVMEPLCLGWRERREKEPALMGDLVPLLKKRAGGRSISGLNAYEQ